METSHVIIVLSIIFAAVVLIFIYDTIMTNRIMKESQNKIVAMLSKVYESAELVIISLFTSLFSWGDDDVDDDIDPKTK